MKRWLKLELLCLALLILICGTLIAQNITEKIETDTAEESDELYILDYDALSELQWCHAGETVSLSLDEEGWHYEEDSLLPLNTVQAERLASAVSEIVAVKTIDTPEDLSIYGLDDPVCTITVTAGEETTFCLGDVKSKDGYCYLSVGDGKVYMVDSALADSFSCGLYDLVLKESIPIMTNVSSMRVKSEVQSYEIDHIENSGIAYTDQYEWFLKDGNSYLVLDNSLAVSFIDKVRILGWQSCADYKATENTLSSYGFDSPSVTVEIDYSLETTEATDILASDGYPIYETLEHGETFILEIGNYTGSGECYARLADSSLIYTIDASLCDALLYMNYADLQPLDVILLDENEIESVTVTFNGGIHVFEKDTIINENKDGETIAETLWLSDGEEADFSDVLYDLLHMYASESAGGEEPKRSAEISFVFSRSNSLHPETELIFYPYDSSSCLVTLDGCSTVFVYRYYVTEIIEKIQQILLNPVE